MANPPIPEPIQKILDEKGYIPPAFASHRLSEATQGHRFVQFAQACMKATRGFRQGQPVVFERWQVEEIFEPLFELNEDGFWRHRVALIGVPRKNGKSMKASTCVLFCLLFGGVGSQIYSAAVDRNQARIIYREVADQIRLNPYLKKRLRITRDKIVNVATGAEYRPLAADGASAQGLGPLIVVCDEIGEWKGKRAEELWAALTEGSGDRPQSLVIGITTAGYNPQSLLGTLYKHGRRVSLPPDHENYLDDPSFFFRWWEAPEGCDPTDPINWYLANPNLAAGLMDYADLKRSIANPTPFNVAKFQRYRLNQWVRIAGVEFVSKQVWNKAAKPGTSIPKGNSIFLGFDGSQSGDSTGIVASDLQTGLLEVVGRWENTKQEAGWYVDKDEVFERLRDLVRDYDVKAIWADPSYFQQDLERWAKKLGTQVVKVPSNQMAKWAQRFTSDLTYGEAFHNEDENLTRHTFNAVLREDGSFEKVARGSSEKIDLLVCATLANAARWHSTGKSEARIEEASIVGSSYDDDDDDW